MLKAEYVTHEVLAGLRTNYHSSIIVCSQLYIILIHPEQNVRQSMMPHPRGPGLGTTPVAPEPQVKPIATEVTRKSHTSKPFITKVWFLIMAYTRYYIYYIILLYLPLFIKYAELHFLRKIIKFIG